MKTDVVTGSRSRTKITYESYSVSGDPAEIIIPSTESGRNTWFVGIDFFQDEELTIPLFGDGKSSGDIDVFFQTQETISPIPASIIDASSDVRRVIFKGNPIAINAIPSGVPSGSFMRIRATAVMTNISLGGSSSGDMEASVYDPNNISSDAFNQDNMQSGSVNKNFTAQDEQKLDDAEVQANKGNPNGYAALDATGRLPRSQLPTTAKEYLGTFGGPSSTTGGDLPASGNTNGDTWECNINGFSSVVAGDVFDSGDQAVFDASGNWTKIDNNDDVVSVFNRKGAVTAQSGDYDLSQISETATQKIYLQSERQKLAGIEPGAEVNVQADMADADPLSDAFVLNKPRHASVKAAITRPSQTTIALCNQQGGVLEDYLTLSFTANRDGLHAINCSILTSLNVTVDDFVSEIEISGDQGFLENENFERTEKKDSAGTGVTTNIISGGAITGSINSGTDQRQRATYYNEFNFVKDEVYTITLRWAPNFDNDRAVIYDGIISVSEKISG